MVYKALTIIYLRSIVWELELLVNLFAYNEGFRGSYEEGNWHWSHDKKDLYFVLATYISLYRDLKYNLLLYSNNIRIFPHVWKSWIPYKINIFS